MMALPRVIRAPLVPALVLVGVGGCFSSAVTPRLYVLSPLAKADAPASAAGGPIVGVGPVGVASYLDRSTIFTRTGTDEMNTSSLHQWAEPLKDGTPRVLAENLAALIPTDSVVVFPWRTPWTIQYRVTMEITRFDGPLGGDVVLLGRWRLLDSGGKQLALRVVTLREPTGDKSYAAMVAAQSRLLAAVSRDIAAEVKTWAK